MRYLTTNYDKNSVKYKVFHSYWDKVFEYHYTKYSPSVRHTVAQNITNNSIYSNQLIYNYINDTIYTL